MSDEAIENSLVKDLLFLFQGIDGKYLSLTDKKTGAAKEKLSISAERSHLTNHLLSVGYYYSKIQEQLAELKKKDTVLLNSLSAYIQQDLNEFHRLLAVLENLLETGESDEFSKSLSLKKLYAWTQEPLVKLSTTSAVLTNLLNSKTHPLTLLSEYSSHGDPFIKSFINSLLDHVSKPFYDMIISWVTKGIAKDKDFFVHDVETSSFDWRQGYLFVKDNVPTFINMALAKKVPSIHSMILLIVRFSLRVKISTEFERANRNTNRRRYLNRKIWLRMSKSCILTVRLSCCLSCTRRVSWIPCKT